MTHKTRAIILRAVKYGETSFVVTALTELFGLQSYMVKGVRTASKKGHGRAVMFQPGALLEMVVYHNEHKNLQFIKEYQWAEVYQHLFSGVIKNAVAMFMVELLLKTVKQPEENPDLYHFCEDSFLALDNSTGTVTANFALFFALHLPSLMGFQLTDNYSAENHILDLQAGTFSGAMPEHPGYVAHPHSGVISQLLKARIPADTATVLLNRDTRQQLLQHMEAYYALHHSQFGRLNTLMVLHEVLG